MIKCSFHGNDAPADPNMAVFVHPSRYPTSTQKMKGGQKFSFPTLLHFPGELLLKGSEIRHGIFFGLMFGPEIFLGFVGSLSDFLGSKGA